MNGLHAPSLCDVSVCVVWQTHSWTPLLAASDNGHVEVVRALVGANAVVNQRDVGDRWGDCCCWVVREWLLLMPQRVREALCACVCCWLGLVPACGIRGHVLYACRGMAGPLFASHSGKGMPMSPLCWLKLGVDRLCPCAGLHSEAHPVVRDGRLLLAPCCIMLNNAEKNLLVVIAR